MRLTSHLIRYLISGRTRPARPEWTARAISSPPPDRSRQIKFAQYVLERLKQVGVTKIFGIPGDFSLHACDEIERDQGVEWVGNASELTASNVADGYARVSRTPGVCFTVFGPGQLSALNGVAAAYVERIPVLHLVGSPSRPSTASNRMLHHMLTPGQASHDAYNTIFKQVTCSQAFLTELPEEQWTGAFDRVLSDVLRERRPGLVEIPQDAVGYLVDAALLERHLPGSVDVPSREPKPTAKKVIDIIRERWGRAQQPVMLVDFGVGRFGLEDQATRLMSELEVPTYNTTLGKGCVDESSPYFAGTWSGASSLGPIDGEVRGADLVLHLGPMKADVNTGLFTALLPSETTIEIYHDHTEIDGSSYPVGLHDIVPHLATALAAVQKPSLPALLAPESRFGPLSTRSTPDTPLSHAEVWPRIAKWIRKDDVIVNETGVSMIAFNDIRFPSGVTYLLSNLWCSIGWSVGAAVGAAIAASQRKVKRRTILFVGDGSLQLTLPELGTALKEGVHPYVFVLNNAGYDIERAVHLPTGPTAKYNDIQEYDHQLVLPMLAGKKCETPHESRRISTAGELDALLSDPEFCEPTKMRLIELVMPQNDMPEAFRRVMGISRGSPERIPRGMGVSPARILDGTCVA